jgi:branched-subunit amino acid ABC-type transport system permease component
MIILGIFNAVFGGDQNNIDYSLGSLSIGFLNVTYSRIMAALGAVAFTAFLYLFLYFTRTGKSIRAVANNREAAELMGIPSTRVLALSFGLGSLLAAGAGSLISTIFPFTIFSGMPYELKSFVICVLGGLGNPLGALIGGLILGLMEGVIPIWMPTSWVPVVEFGLFVLVLVVKPTGLLGAK